MGLPVGLQGGLEDLASEGAVDGDHAAGRQFLACGRGQHQEGPGCALWGGGAGKLCFEVDWGGGFGHVGTLALVAVNHP